MSRPLRDFRPRRTYLVSQQGNKQISVYIDERDRAYAAELLRICALRYDVEVLAYGFGEYEGRWLLRPSTRTGISNLMRDMQSSYSRFLNGKYAHHPCCAHRRRCHRRRSDPLRNSSNWTPRFRVTEISPEYLSTAIRLVHEVRVEQPGPSPKRRKSHNRRPFRPSPDLQLLREALRRSLPFATVSMRL